MTCISLCIASFLVGRFVVSCFAWLADSVETSFIVRSNIRPIVLVVLVINSMKEILQYLKSHGEQLDREIAAATGISLTNVHLHLAELAAKGEIMACHSIKFEKGTKVEGISCRLAGYIPPAAPGRKSKSQLKIS